MPEGGDGKKVVPCSEEWPKEAKKSATELPSLSVWDRRKNSNEVTRALMSRIKAVAKHLVDIQLELSEELSSNPTLPLTYECPKRDIEAILL
ncbi:hypothetical protein SLA2020_036060 [Shorea laevis]